MGWGWGFQALPELLVKILEGGGVDLKEGSLLEGKRRGREPWVSSHPRRGGEGPGRAGLHLAGALTESKGGKVG